MERQWTVTNSKFKTSHVEGVLKMASSPLKRKAPLQESQPERKKSKLSNREKHVFVNKW